LRPRNGDISLFQRFLAIDKTVPDDHCRKRA
jgi:hypothetical protein